MPSNRQHEVLALVGQQQFMPGSLNTWITTTKNDLENVGSIQTTGFQLPQLNKLPDFSPSKLSAFSRQSSCIKIYIVRKKLNLFTQTVLVTGS